MLKPDQQTSVRCASYSLSDLDDIRQWIQAEILKWRATMFFLFEPCYLQQKTIELQLADIVRKGHTPSKIPHQWVIYQWLILLLSGDMFHSINYWQHKTPPKYQQNSSLRIKTPPASRNKSHPNKTTHLVFTIEIPRILPSPLCLPRFLLICFQLWFRWSVFPQLGKKAPTVTGVDRLAETLRSVGMLWEGFNL